MATPTNRSAIQDALKFSGSAHRLVLVDQDGLGFSLEELEVVLDAPRPSPNVPSKATPTRTGEDVTRVIPPP